MSQKYDIRQSILQDQLNLLRDRWKNEILRLPLYCRVTSWKFHPVMSWGYSTTCLIRKEFHGNEIALRSAYLPSGARKSWIDADLVLPSGWLREFWFYTHNMPESLPEPDVSNIRLQIWGQEGNSDSYMYKLRWEYRVTNLDLGSNNGKAWRVSIPFLKFS